MLFLWAGNPDKGFFAYSAHLLTDTECQFPFKSSNLFNNLPKKVSNRRGTDCATYTKNVPQKGVARDRRAGKRASITNATSTSRSTTSESSLRAMKERKKLKQRVVGRSCPVLIRSFADARGNGQGEDDEPCERAWSMKNIKGPAELPPSSDGSASTGRFRPTGRRNQKPSTYPLRRRTGPVR